MASDQAIQPHGGQRFGACFSSNPPSNNDWFISPHIRMGTNGYFSFWVKSYTSFYGLDEYIVAVSTTDSLPASFSPISGASPLQTTTGWEKKTFNLSAFNGQEVYLAIRCVSNDRFLMMIDDVEIHTEASSMLEADFTADHTTIRVGETVNFSDQSSGLPTSWVWSFPGAEPSSSVEQNPGAVKYNQAGTFPVSLKVSNTTSTDSITRPMYINVTGYPSSMTLDFEELSDFSLTFDNWTVQDVGGGSTYGINGVTFLHSMDPMAWICFNPGHTTPPLTNMFAHSGQKLGCSFSSMPPKNPNNKWLISPKLSLGFNPQVELWVQTYNPLYGDEKFNIAVSTTDTNPLSFNPVNLVPEIAPVVWTKKVFNLSNYSGQDVYVGIQCVTNDVFIFMIDDIAITSTVGIGDHGEAPSCGLFPNPARESVTLLTDAPVESVGVACYSIAGTLLGSETVATPGGRGRMDIGHLAPGVYIFRITIGNHEINRKLTVID
jgi:PKD repeat protein